MAATIRSEVKIIPDRIHLGEISPRQKVKRKIIVLDEGNGSLKVEDVTAPDNVEVRILPFELKNNIRYIPIILSVKGGEIPGPFSDTINIMTNNPQSDGYNVQISGNIVSKAKIYPPRLFLTEPQIYRFCWTVVCRQV